ncbi:MAG: Asp-tRNA(Asn)/Glu-tRNA(Gln) amidotransferase subunit GatB [Planctomycetales bacterium]
MSHPHEIVIGLEVHVQLLTDSKLFCGCSAKFGSPPNTQTCPVCLGLPGSLPVMNRKAFELSVKTALALNCRIAEFCKWDRKNYYYPDLPKGFQTSQFDLPFSSDGHLTFPCPQTGEPRRIRILRAHLEEDAGKSMHDEKSGTADSRVDLNRVGTPLLEIVSEPDLRSAEEAKIYLTDLKLLLTHLGVSDCNMQEGSLRVDANVNLHIDAAKGKVATPIVEVKNMNSFRAVERAIEYEAARQYDLWKETGKKIGDMPKQTWGWNDERGVTLPQRQKEESSDYRYFPEPDLVPVTTTPEEIERIRAELGESPEELQHRLQQEFGLTEYDAGVLVNQGRPLVDYYLELADLCGDPKSASNWMQQDVMRVLNEQAMTIDRYPISAASLAELLKKVQAKEVSTARGRDVLAKMIESGQSAAETMKTLGVEQVDESSLVELCRELLAANPGIVAQVKEGKAKAAGALIGQAKQKNPNINPGRVREICLELIETM